MGKAETLRAALTGTCDALLAATLAPACACCHTSLSSPTAGPVCSRCWADARAAAGRYDGALRGIIHAFKYEGRRSLARPLAALLRAQNGAAFDGAACVVPVPLFFWRRLQRGFNQADALAQELYLPVVHALWRMRPTATQTGLTAVERQRNVHGAIGMSPLVSSRSRARFIADRIVVVVDDVMTTGATLNACAEALASAGAREVRTVTVARAPLHGRHEDTKR